MRKKRNDRNHVIYQILNKITGESYIGVTVSKKRAFLKSVKQRWKRHIYRAVVEESLLPISVSIREFGESSFSVEILEVVRGKKPAFARESELINEFRPVLNTKMKMEYA